MVHALAYIGIGIKCSLNLEKGKVTPVKKVFFEQLVIKLWVGFGNRREGMEHSRRQFRKHCGTDGLNKP